LGRRGPKLPCSQRCSRILQLSGWLEFTLGRRSRGLSTVVGLQEKQLQINALCRICRQARPRLGRNFANLSRNFAVIHQGKDDGSKLWRTDAES
jgi:hypothetical protein